MLAASNMSIAVSVTSRMTEHGFESSRNCNRKSEMCPTTHDKSVRTSNNTFLGKPNIRIGPLSPPKFIALPTIFSVRRSFNHSQHTCTDVCPSVHSVALTGWNFSSSNSSGWSGSNRACDRLPFGICLNVPIDGCDGDAVVGSPRSPPCPVTK